MDAQQKALERTIAAGANVLSDKHAALVELCRLLASQIDDAGPELGPSNRLSAAYLSALKDLGRIMAATEDTRRTGKLAQLRALQAVTESRQGASLRKSH